MRFMDMFFRTCLYKWIEAAAYSLMMKADDSLEHTIDEMVDLLEEATLNDGYLDTFYSIKNPKKRFSNLRDHHELYCFGHLAEAAVAYYEATGKKQLLHLAERFADLICELFGKEEGKCHGYPGHELAEMALVRLYRHTGKTSYLELARYFVLERGREPNYFRKEHGRKRFRYALLSGAAAGARANGSGGACCACNVFVFRAYRSCGRI